MARQIHHGSDGPPRPAALAETRVSDEAAGALAGVRPTHCRIPLRLRQRRAAVG